MAFFTKRSDNALYLRDAISRPILDKTGRAMDDKQLILSAVKSLDEHTKKYGELPPVPPKFVAWLHGAAAAIKNGESLADYKRRTVYKQIGDYAILRNVSK